MSVILLSLFGCILAPIIGWFLHKLTDKDKQDEEIKGLKEALNEKNKEVEIMAAPDRGDADILNSLRKHQQH